MVINSRSEKADFTPMFQRAVRERRCLVPVSGFYEWRRTPSGGKTKDKFAFQSQGGVDKGLMYLAGVYGEFLGGFRAGGFDGFAILTREADEQMRPYHDRMPVILGDMGAGKSELTRGIARGLGVTGYVTSPTFTILQVHEEGRLPLYHFDWYRLESAEELYELAMDEYLQNGGVAVVEWPCRAPEAVPACRLEVEITPLGDTDRALRFTPVGGFRELDWEGWIS